MNIEIGAFNSCSSLKEIRFKNMIEPVFIDILDDDNLPDDYKIIVPDNMYELMLSKYHSSLYTHILSYTENKKELIKKTTKNFDIYLAICHLNYIKNITKIQLIIDILVKKYDLDLNMLDKIKMMFNV